jgi:hypothetical protein
MSDECEFVLPHDQSNAMQNVSSNIANYICLWFINSDGCEDFTYPDIQGVCNFYSSSVNLNMVAYRTCTSRGTWLIFKTHSREASIRHTFQ